MLDTDNRRIAGNKKKAGRSIELSVNETVNDVNAEEGSALTIKLM